MNLSNLILLASDYAHRNDSAKLCLRDACNLNARGNEEGARRRALDSLKHSVGILHAAYQLATAELCEVYNSDDGCTLGGTVEGVSYEAALAVAADWNHSGAPNLFRVRPHSPRPAAGFTGYNGFTAGVN